MAGDFADEGFAPAPPGTEPPEGDVELALQEEALLTEAATPATSPPPVVGRTWRLDLAAGRLQPEGGLPLPIYGTDAMRQAVEKALRTERASAPVHGDDYGLEAADEQVEGQPFDAAAFADLEERVRDCLLALPWVLDVTNYRAEGSQALDVAVVSFRVIPEGDADPIDLNRFPLPL